MYPVWNRTAKEFAERLEKIASVKSVRLAKKMREFAEAFESWSQNGVPSGIEKSQVIGDYMTCYRDALDLFSREIV